MEELHRRFEMSDLITKRAKWVDEQLFQMSRWQVSGGSKVQRAIAAGEAFDIASGIRQLGVQKVPVASVAPTKALSTLTEDIDFLETFPYTERESRSQQRKLEKVPLLAMSKRVEQADQLLLQDIGTPRVIAFPLDDGRQWRKAQLSPALWRLKWGTTSPLNGGRTWSGIDGARSATAASCHRLAGWYRRRSRFNRRHTNPFGSGSVRRCVPWHGLRCQR